MGCRGKMESEPDHREYTKNPRRDEEFEDVSPNDDEDMYFEFEQGPKVSSCAVLIINRLVITILTIFSINWGARFNWTGIH